MMQLQPVRITFYGLIKVHCNVKPRLALNAADITLCSNRSFTNEHHR